MINVSGILIILCFFVTSSYSGEADVVAVQVKKTGSDLYSFRVTVKHNDEGWNHYANKWDIVGEDGAVYGTRTLLHPHVDEQPFTRSFSGVKIPAGIAQVKVRANDVVHKYGGEVVQVTLPLE